MYYSNQFKPKSKEAASGLLKRLPRQLAVVLAVMLVLILLRYTSSKTGENINNSARSFFYMDMTDNADQVFVSFKGTLQGFLDGDKSNAGDNNSGSQKDKSTPAIVLGSNPISGSISITSHYGDRVSPIDNEEETHTGIDIDAPVNTPVMAVMEGTVVEWKNDENYGLTILISHGNGCTTRYAHLSKIAEEAMEPGEVVEKGQIIAYSGESGKVTGPHLHFEILIDGKTVDPEPYLLAAASV
jgi:murein DD-endopeptidase MepM/ murein hydrolase activator NlpD